MNAISALRLIAAVMFGVLAVYTLIVGMDDGWNILPLFLGDIVALNWNGQFNLDFMGFLALSALWVAWRHAFSPAGMGLALAAFFGGILFLSAYLLIHAIPAANGDMKKLLMGAQA